MASHRQEHAARATESQHAPLVLLVPDKTLGPSHWMRQWQRWNEDAQVLELGMWDAPHRNTWVNRLNLAIRRAERPVVIVTEGIAAMVLAWWHEFEQVEAGEQENLVTGAIAVTPPDFDLPGGDLRLATLGACPRRALPFATYVVSSLDDPLGAQRSALRLAADWGAWLVRDDVRGDWRSGWPLLRALLGREEVGELRPGWHQDEFLAIREAMRERSVSA